MITVKGQVAISHMYITGLIVTLSLNVSHDVVHKSTIPLSGLLEIEQ